MYEEKPRDAWGLGPMVCPRPHFLCVFPVLEFSHRSFGHGVLASPPPEPWRESWVPASNPTQVMVERYEGWTLTQS